MKNEILIGREFPQAVIPLIKNAKKSINIIVFDWGWYADEIGEQIQIFNNAIYNANKHGVKIQVIAQKKIICSILKGLNISVKKFESKKLLHTKLMIIDEEIAILGSHNYTKNAFNINHEVSIITQNKKNIEKLQNYFNNLFN